MEIISSGVGTIATIKVASTALKGLEKMGKNNKKKY
jgi:hypothetical protein